MYITVLDSIFILHSRARGGKIELVRPLYVEIAATYMVVSMREKLLHSVKHTL